MQESSPFVRERFFSRRKRTTTALTSIFRLNLKTTNPRRHSKQAAECPARDVEPAVLGAVGALAVEAGPNATAELVCDAVCALERTLISTGAPAAASADAAAAAAATPCEPCSCAGAAVFVAAAMRGCPEAATLTARRLLSRGWGSHQGRSRLLLWALAQAAASADGGPGPALAAWAGVVLPAIVGGGGKGEKGAVASTSTSSSSTFGSAAALDAVAFAEAMLFGRGLAGSAPLGSSPRMNGENGGGAAAGNGKGNDKGAVAASSSSPFVPAPLAEAAARGVFAPGGTSLSVSPVVRPSALSALLAGALPCASSAVATTTGGNNDGPSTSGNNKSSSAAAAPRIVRPRLLALLPRLSAVAALGAKEGGFDVSSAVAGVIAVAAAAASVASASTLSSEASTSAITGSLAPLFAADPEAAAKGWRAAVAAAKAPSSRKGGAGGAAASSSTSAAAVSAALAAIAEAVSRDPALTAEGKAAAAELAEELRAAVAAAAAGAGDGAFSSSERSSSPGNTRLLSRKAAAAADRARRRRQKNFARGALAALALAALAAALSTFTRNFGGPAGAGKVVATIAGASAEAMRAVALSALRELFAGAVAVSALLQQGWRAFDNFVGH